MNRSMGALVLVVVASGCTTRDGRATRDRTYRIAGSDTELNVVQRLTEAFRAQAPDVAISVTGGGSGSGIAALVEGRADVANASRRASPEEREAAEQAGRPLEEIKIGVDALAVIVNADNPITSLSIEQMGRLFRGQASRWSDVGGLDRPVTLYGRQSNSGTYGYFRSAVLRGDYDLKMLSMNGNAQIVEAVRQDPNGIGYVGVGYVSRTEAARQGLTVLAVSSNGEAPVSPLDVEAVSRGDYPIARPLYQYFSGDLAAGLLHFLEFELSPEGQAIVQAEGFHPVPPSWREESRHALASIAEGT